jgi:hypothetical protein
MNPLGMLALVGIMCGAAMIWIFRRTANGPAIHAAARRIQAHLLEFWLFVDEPRTIWKSWKGLLAANARLLALLLVPVVILSIPSVPLFFFLDAVYGTSPLPVGKPALVTVGFDDSPSQIPALLAPDGMSVESPPVRVSSRRQVSWRIRPLRPLSGDLQFIVGRTKLSTSVTAGDSFRYHTQSRTRSSAGPIQWIEISYPSAELVLLGWEAHWSVWFLAFSIFGALIAHYFSRAAAIRSRS